MSISDKEFYITVFHNESLVKEREEAIHDTETMSHQSPSIVVARE
jgi:hypothetical protein